MRRRADAISTAHSTGWARVPCRCSVTP
jgi:hypothetical protein